MGLRVKLDGRWNAAEFAEFYQALNDLYQFYLFDRDPFWWKHGPYGRYVGYRRFDFSNLEVQRIQFASPGFTDLAGIAAAIKEVREFIQFLINHFSTSEDRKLDREMKGLEIQEKKLDLLRKLADLPDILPGKAEDLEALVGVRSARLPNIDPIINGVIEGRIVGCENVETKRQEAE